MKFDGKAQIVKSGDDLLKLTNRQPDSLSFLRAYNGWYTSTLEFVQYQAGNRLQEFEDLHSESQTLLCGLKPDLQRVKVNLTIQIAIIEGSTDHDIHIENRRKVDTVSNQTPKQKKSLCGPIILVIVSILSLWFMLPAVFPSSARVAYMKCKEESMDVNPYTDRFSSYGQSTITRSSDTFTVLFTTYEDNHYVPTIFVSDMECVINHEGDNWEVMSLKEIDEYIIPSN